MGRSRAAEETEDRRSAYRRGYRGYVMQCLAVEQVIKCAPSNFTRAKIESQGLPLDFYWPVFEDYDGAELLIDAVIDRNVPAILKLNARHPEFDFKLGRWFEELRAQYQDERAVVRRTLRSRAVGIGCTLRLEVETNSKTGIRTVRRSLYRGQTRIASDLLATDSPAPKGIP